MGIRQDLLLAARMLRKSPGFAAAAVLSLALALGAASAVWSVVGAILLRALPYQDPDRIVLLAGPGEGDDFRPSSLPEYVDYSEQTAVFSQVAASAMSFMNLTGESEPLRLVATRVSPDFFPLLGFKAAIGRTIGRQDAEPAAPHIAVLSHGLWQRQYGGDARVLGRALTLSGEPYTVIGVMPDSLHFEFGPAETDVFLPLVVDRAHLPRRNQRPLGIAARLREGVTVEQSQAALDALARRLRAEYPDVYQGAGWRLLARPLGEVVVGPVVRWSLLVLFGVVGLLLAITCANLASLMLSRSLAREREVALRAALGASRGALIRQFLAEALLLAGLGGVLGLALAWAMLKVLVAINPEKLPRLHEIGIDAGGVAFTAGVTLLTAVACGLLPALAGSRSRSYQSLKEGGRGATLGGGRLRLRHAVVIGEIALALVVLAGTGLVVKSFFRLQSVDPGFRSADLLTLQVFLPVSKYPTESGRAQCAARVLAGLKALPRVERAGLANSLPLSEIRIDVPMTVEGRALAPGEAPWMVDWRSADGGYFAAMGIALLSGRTFTEADDLAAPEVAIVNQALARAAWPEGDPVGQRARLERPDGKVSSLVVVGVVHDVQAQGPGTAAGPQLYTPFAQTPRPLLSFVLRTRSEPLQLAGDVRGVVRSVDRDLPVEKVQTMEQVVERSLTGRRSYMALLAFFAGVSLLLVGLGVYGVVAYAAAQRVQEIGIRMSLGAQRGDVLRLFLRHGLALTGVGLVLGLLLSLGASRWVAGLLYDVSTTDTPTLAAVSLLLLVIVLVATYLPARRATRVDPVTAMRPD